MTTREQAALWWAMQFIAGIVVALQERCEACGFSLAECDDGEWRAERLAAAAL